MTYRTRMIDRVEGNAVTWSSKGRMETVAVLGEIHRDHEADRATEHGDPRPFAYKIRIYIINPGGYLDRLEVEEFHYCDEEVRHYGTAPVSAYDRIDEILRQWGDPRRIPLFPCKLCGEIPTLETHYVGGPLHDSSVWHTYEIKDEGCSRENYFTRGDGQDLANLIGRWNTNNNYSRPRVPFAGEEYENEGVIYTPEPAAK